MVIGKTIESSPQGLSEARARVRVAFLAGLALLASGAPSRVAAPEALAAGRARLLTVSATGACAAADPCFTTIQAAIDAAVHGDTIEVLPGIYAGPIIIDRKVPVSARMRGAAAPEERLVVRRAAAAAPGSVVISGGGTCTRGVVQIRRSQDVTLRGFVIEASGAAIELAGTAGGNARSHLEQNVLLGNASCGAGVRVARGRGTLVLNNLIAGFGSDGIRLRAGGGPHWLVQNTVHANGGAGVAIGREGEVRLIDNAISDNGRRPGGNGRVSGIHRAPGSRNKAESALLMGNVACGNQGGEIAEWVLDATDAANRTPAGTEGPGVSPAGADCAPGLFVDGSGDDGIPGTADDDLTPAAGSALADGPVDPTSLAGLTGLAAEIAADLLAEGARPQDSDADGVPAFDVGAIERRASTEPTPTPTDPTPTPQATPTPEPSVTPEPPPGGELRDGETFFGIDGVAIGAVAGTLADPLAVSIEKTPPPALALPGGVIPHGMYYRLAGDRDIQVASGTSTGFVTALPIPAGVSTEHLGLAVFLPGDPADPTSPDDWFVLPGRVDTARGALLAVLPHVAAAGQVLVLIEHPGLSSPSDAAAPIGVPASARASALTSSAAGQPRSHGTSFIAVCLLSDEVDQEICQSLTSVVEDGFQDVFGETTSDGHPRPAIHTLASASAVSPPSVIDSLTYLIHINRDGAHCSNAEEGILGYYNPEMLILNMCITPDGPPLSSTFVGVTRHEFFHAIQWGHPAVYADWQAGRRERWLIESTASLFEGSTRTTIGRTQFRKARFVDRPFASIEDQDEYELQDFWLFLLKESGETDVSRFAQLFSIGATMDAVTSWLGSAASFKSWYWRWVKNQAGSQEGKSFNGDPIPDCRLQTASVEQLITTVDTTAERILSPLTAEVFLVQVPDDIAEVSFWEAYKAFQGDANIEFKIAKEGGSRDCLSMDEGYRTFFNLQTGEQLLIIVANTHLTEARPTIVQFD